MEGSKSFYLLIYLCFKGEKQNKRAKNNLGHNHLKSVHIPIPEAD